jgi:hypothetical protein
MSAGDPGLRETKLSAIPARFSIRRPPIEGTLPRGALLDVEIVEIVETVETVARS